MIAKEILPPSLKKGACILCATLSPDRKVKVDLYTLFLIPLGVSYKNIVDGFQASTLIGTAAPKVKGVETEISQKNAKSVQL